MRALALACLLLSGCRCDRFGIEERRFACSSNGDCAQGYRCVRQSCQKCATPAECPDIVTCDGAPVDLKSDPRHCGRCDNACPAALHAAAACVSGQCRRGPCEAGWVDADGALTAGCESRCERGTLTFPDGGTVAVTACAPGESGMVAHAFAAGGAYGDKQQNDGVLTHTATLGQPTPLPADGGAESSHSQVRNRAGFGASEP